MAALEASLAGSRELGLAAVAHLSRYRGTSRKHTESDLRIFITWCQERQLAPLDAQRNDLERHARVTAAEAASIVSTRDKLGHLSSVDELVVHGDLTLATAERLRDYAVFIG
jgi:hypothetical protein